MINIAFLDIFGFLVFLLIIYVCVCLYVYLIHLENASWMAANFLILKK